jgi:hypothetical protein
MLVPLFVKFGQMVQKLKNNSQQHISSRRESQLDKPIMNMKRIPDRKTVLFIFIITNIKDWTL